MFLVNSSYHKFTLAPVGISLVAGLSRLIAALDHFFHPRSALRKPGWVHCSERGWRRHSAYIVSRSSQARGDYHDG